MNHVKKKLFSIFLLFYFLIGSYSSLNTGISFDERYEELNWKFNVNLIKDISKDISKEEKFNRKKFDAEVKNFVGYGIGFQLISQPIQHFIKKLPILKNNLDSFGAKLVAKHFVVFLFFFISGIFFYLILKKLINNENFCIIGSIVYLTYPYLFGQAMFSPKDVPFMSVWLMCTYLSFILFEILIKKNKINLIHLLFISFTTAYLLSVRIAGILIFIQYLILLMLFLSIYENNFIKFFKKFYLKILFFLSSTIIFTFLLNPFFWIDPFLLIETIKINANHFNNVGTTTFGRIMYAKDLPSTYLLIWLAVKIPLLILLGIIILPITEKKIFENKKTSIFFGNILLSIIIIIFFLIFKKVHLYDEIRQVMFLVPLIFIIGLVSLYLFSKKLFYLIGVLSIIFFITENIKINPYQYVWFNIPSRYVDLTEKFELEYQGISGREIAKQISKLDYEKTCILVNPIHSVEPFLDKSKFNCFDIWQKIDTDYKRPFLAVQNVRNLKKSMPYNCVSIFETHFKLLFQKEKFITGKLLRCN